MHRPGIFTIKHVAGQSFSCLGPRVGNDFCRNFNVPQIWCPKSLFFYWNFTFQLRAHARFPDNPPKCGIFPITNGWYAPSLLGSHEFTIFRKKIHVPYSNGFPEGGCPYRFVSFLEGRRIARFFPSLFGDILPIISIFFWVAYFGYGSKLGTPQYFDG